MTKFISRRIWTLLLIAGGCASSDPGAPPAPVSFTPIHGLNSARPAKAQCLVCKDNADLACLDVDVAPDTPTHDYQGNTYYFCSRECRQQFARDPKRYSALAE